MQFALFTSAVLTFCIMGPDGLEASARKPRRHHSPFTTRTDLDLDLKKLKGLDALNFFNLM